METNSVSKESPLTTAHTHLYNAAANNYIVFPTNGVINANPN